MLYKLSIRPLATLEIIEAYDWYESQKSGLGFHFLSALEEFYNKLRINPLTHSFYDNPIRQGTLHKFPYIIVYEVFDAEIIVYSVFMAKRNPEGMRTF